MEKAGISPLILWQSSAQFPTLTKSEIHIWCANLKLTTEEAATLSQYLAADERKRAERFKFEIHRHRFIAAKGTLRKILGKYLEISPEKIKFSAGPHGKPYLDKSINQELLFNSSDSQNLALYAVVLNHEIGVDVEYIREDFASKEVAQRFFSPYENQVLQGLPEAQKTTTFFACWTRKEAFIKALGKGLSYPLDQFDVSLAPEESAKLRRVGDDPEEAGRWQLCDLKPAQNFVAAVAVKEKNMGQLRTWRV